MDSCIFSYYITTKDVVIEELPIRKVFGKYNVFVDKKTPYNFTERGEVSCAIFGYAINLITNKSENLAEDICLCDKIADVIEYEKNLGGKYIILFKNKENYYLLGDATCSIPVFYGEYKNEFVCSCNINYIVKSFNISKDEELQQIRDSSDISQAMPFDITAYKEIKQLIPNHYLDLDGKKSVRFVNCKEEQKKLSVKEATNIVFPLIDRLVDYYKKEFKIYCPITSGKDSRVVLSFLYRKDENVKCYTISHDNFTEKEEDLVVPKKICGENNINYEVIKDVNNLDEITNQIDKILGKNEYSIRTLQIATTIKNNYGDGAIINGDIIGQVGKCSLHRDIPCFLAKPNYFVWKSHNYSKNAKKHFYNWVKEIGFVKEKVNRFDLFSIENRLGRWAGQENLIYNFIGQVYLNIFNSRSIIYTWTAVSRKKRKKNLLHLSLIEKNMAKFLDYSFGKESLLEKVAKLNGLTYYVASFFKYAKEKNSFKKGK